MPDPKHLLPLIFLACAFKPLLAQDVPTTGLMIEDSNPLGTGLLELSSTYTDRVLEGSYGIIVAVPDGFSERSQSIALGAAYGVSDGLDVMTELQWTTEFSRGGLPERNSGFGDFRLGMKLRLWELSPQAGLSWVTSFSVPMAVLPQSPLLAFVGTDQLLVLSGTSGHLASTIQAGLHFGYADPSDPNFHLHLAAGFGYQAAAAVQPRLELHVEDAPFDDGRHLVAAMMMGLTWQVDAQLRVDLGFHSIAIGEDAWDERTFFVRFVFAP